MNRTVFAYVLICMTLIASSASFSQSISTTAFSNTTSTYTTIIGQGGTTLIFDSGSSSDNDDDYYSGIPIGFTFNYLGGSYTTVDCNANGFALLGGSSVSGNSWTPDISGSSGSSGRPVLAPFWSDLELLSGSGGTNLGYTMTGTAPNRVFTLEWNKVEWTYLSGVLSFSFQIKLYENNGAVEYCYNQEDIQSSTQNLAIGISSSATGSGSFLTLVDNNFNTVSNTNAFLPTMRPASNTKFTFVQFSTLLTSPSGFSATNVTPGGMTLNFTNNASSANSAAIFYSTDNTNFSQVGSVALSGTGAYSYALSGLSSGTTYYFRIYAMETGGTSSALTGTQATPVQPLSGTRTIPSTNYPNIKTAIDSMAVFGINGPLTFELSATYNSSVEPTWPLTFVPVSGASATNVITIRPASGATNLSISKSNATGLILLNGIDYFVIDGRPGGTGTTSQLLLENTYVGSTFTVKFIADATYNTVRYCSIRSANTSTSSGNIFFSTPTVTGNNYNTVSNNDIREATGGGLQAIGIYSLGTSSVPSHHNNVTNNNIFNFGGTSSTYGMYSSSGYYHTWTITGNSFYQTAARTLSGTHGFIYNSETGTNTGINNVVTGNYFGGSAPNCGGSAMTATTSSTFYGIYMPGSTATYGTKTISGNVLTNMSITSSTSVYFIYAYYNENTYTNNVIGSASQTGAITITNSGTSSMTVYGIYGYPYQTLSENMVLSGNTVGGITMNTSSTGSFNFYGLYWASSFQNSNSVMDNNLVGSTSVANSINAAASGSTVAQTVRGIYLASSTGSAALTVSNNTVANMNNASTYATSGGSYIHGIYGSTGIHSFIGNSIYNLSNSAGNASSTNTTMSVVGIMEGSTTAPSGPNGHVVRGNKIYNLVNANTATASIWVVGLSLNAPTGAVYNQVNNNFIHSLNSQSSTTSVFVGMLTYSSPMRIYNNMIRIGVDASGNSVSGSVSMYGLYKNGTYPATIANNSIYVGGSGASGGNTFCMWRNAIPTSGADNIRNNVMQNARTNGSGTGAHICVMVGNSSAANAAAAYSALTLNNNLYYHAGSGGNIGGILYTPGSTIYVYASMNAWSGASTQDGSSGYSNPNYVYPAGSSSTVNLHITGTSAARGGGATVSVVTDDYDSESRPSSFPDIGADQCNSCTANDIFAPTISYTPLGNGIVESSRAMSNVSITDYTGINTSSGTKPRLYFKRSDNADQYIGNTSTDNGWKWVEATGSSSPFSFTIDYSLLTASPAVGDIIQYFVIAQDLVSTPNVGVNACAFTSYPSSVSIANSSFPSANYRSYTIASTLSGTVNVGPTESITSLTNTGGLFDVINNRVVTGNINVVITGNSTTETGTVALNQTSEYGSGGYSITIRPAASTNDTISGSYAGGLIRLNGADRVIFDGRPTNSGSSRNLTFINTATTGTIATFHLVSQGTGLGAVNDTLRYLNVATGSNSNTTAHAVFSGASTVGTAGDDNDNFAFIGNFMYRTYYGVRLLGTASGRFDNVSIVSNFMGSLGAGLPTGDTVRFSGLIVSYANSADVSQNLFKDWSWTTSGVNAISFDNVDGLNFNRNTVDDFIGTTSSAYDFQALWLGSNVINANITRNKFNKIQYQSTGDWWAYGIYINTGNSSSNILIANNMISNVANDYTTGTTYTCTGLRIITTGGVKIYNNTILLRGPYFNMTTAAYGYAAMIMTGCSNIELLNNIFSNRMYGYSGSKSYGLYIGATGQISNIDYNNYDVSLGTTQGVVGNIAGTDYTSFPAFKLALGAENHGQGVPVSYIDSTATADLHLSQQEPGFIGSSAVSSSVTSDYDGYARTNYLIGADEVTPVLTITQQPSSVSVCEQQSASFSAAIMTPVTFNDGVNRSSTVSYRWYLGSNAISGATNATYSISSVATSDAGSYTCRIFSSTIDSVVTNAAVLTVNTLPAITQDPSGANRCLGANMIFNGSASGTGVVYQWQKLIGSTWTNISGATASSFTIPSLVAGDYGQYRFIASGTCTPAATSNAATLTQLTPTSITTQPTATPSSICLGANFTLSVSAQASNIGYQWRRNGNTISGATASTLTITNAQSTDFATYSVVVSGDCGAVTSQNVIVSQIAPTVITAQPSSSTPQVCLGQPFTISVGATGASLSYQWRKAGSPISGATATSYSVAAATAADFASYDVIVTGTCGSLTSSPITIVQIPATQITSNPTASTTLCQGALFSVNVGASGANLVYQWQKLNGTNWVNIPGATVSAFTIAAVAPSDAGSYRAVVTGTCGSLNSTTADLIVNTPISITQQPQFSAANACTGETTTLSMTATGTVSSYQWQKFDGATWQNISGATNSSLVFASLVLTDAGSYRMLLNGPCSATQTSNQAVLAVQQNVQISSNPQGQTACTGGTISFTVTTIGTVVGYQWEQDRTGSGTYTPISGATNATYTKSGVSNLDSGLYRVKVTGNCSAIPVISQPATATIQSIFNIVGQPTWPSTPYNVGQTVTLTVTTTGTANFQWQRDQQRNGSWVNVGTNAPSYSYVITTVADSGNYRCVVSGPCGAVTQNTNTVAVYTCQPPSITTQPVAPQPVCAGGALSLSVSVNGNGQAISYQWFLDAARNGTWVAITGATNSSYSKSNVQTSDDGFYRVQVISACSAVPVYSNAVSFVVLTTNTVTTNPVSQTVCAGVTVTMSVVASGASPSYQWYYNGAPINTGQNTTAQNASLVLTNVQPGTSGSYSCFVTGPCSTTGVFSASATLTVNTPVVLLQPQSQTGCVGTPLTFTTQISGSGLSYQWQKNSTNIPGATNSSYTITSPVLSDAGSYRVIGSNSCGTVTSAAATLSMTVPAAISTQPISQAICRGTTLNLSVGINADATGPAYQWQRNGSNLSLTTYPTANTANLTIGNIQPSEAGNYTCIVMSACQPVGFSSSVATIVVNPSTAITTQPVGGTICEGNSFTMAVGAVGTNLSYQWIKDGAMVFGATNSALTIASPVASDAGNYYCIVSGSCSPSSVNSSTINLTVNTNPRITSANLSNQQACVGSTVNYTVTASGTGLSYQWRFNGSAISGNASATTPNLVLTNVSVASAGQYDCLVRGTCSPSGVSTNSSTLVINTPIAIQTQPQSQVVCSRTDVRFSVVNSGTGATYQWRLNGSAINNNGSAATSTLVLSGITSVDAGVYDVVISGTCNTVVSSPATLNVQTQLMITTQPEPQRLCVGGTITTSTSVIGTVISYQWQRDGVNISGQTNATLSVTNAVTSQSGGYRCIITGSTACGTTQQVTNTVDVIVGLPATITTQPADVAVSYGATVSVMVNATGLGRGVNNLLQYAWFKGSTQITDDAHFSGSTTNVLTIRGVQPGDIGTDYRVQAIGICGVANSNTFALYVPSVTITSQPSASTICSGGDATFSVTAVPTPAGGTLYYQWFQGTTSLVDGGRISGANTASLNITSVAVGDSGSYSCQITVQPGGSRVTSNAAQLQVNSSPAIATQPADAAVCLGSAMSFSVVANGGSLTYQWLKDGTAISGATNATFSISAAAASDAGVYSVSVRNSCGVSTSSVARGSIAPPPIITSQPVSQTVGLNAVFTVSVNAAGSGTLRYQWRHNGAVIAGATNSSYTVTGTTLESAGLYTCEVSSDCGSVTSNPANVTITSVGVVDAEQFGFSLMNPEPNPISDFATIRIRVPQTSMVSVDVTDLQGRVVSTLLNGLVEAGEKVLVLNASGDVMPSGRYVVRLLTAEGYLTTKAIVVIH